MLDRTLKAAQAAALALAVCFSLGATDIPSRFNDLGHRMMCTCGCEQIMLECNHVGCPTSGPMRNELNQMLAAGQGDKDILSAFAVKYGQVVLAAPTTEGFNLVAWIMPGAVFLGALLGTILLVRRWKVPQSASAPASTANASSLSDRIRREAGIEEEKK